MAFQHGPFANDRSLAQSEIETIAKWVDGGTPQGDEKDAPPPINWQILYQPAKPIRMPKGTKMYVDAHYDNSTANKANPNPNRTVYLGRMTWEEMMAPFFGVLVDANTDPGKVLKLGGSAVQGGGA